MRLGIVAALALALVLAGTSHHTNPPTPAPEPPVHAVLANTPNTGPWVITDSYVDPAYGRRTVICVDAHGDLRTATGWREVDVPGGAVGAACPAGPVLDQGQFAGLTDGATP